MERFDTPGLTGITFVMFLVLVWYSWPYRVEYSPEQKAMNDLVERVTAECGQDDWLCELDRATHRK